MQDANQGLLSELRLQVENAAPANKQQRLHELYQFVAGIPWEQRLQNAITYMGSQVRGDLGRAAVARQGGADSDRADYKDTLGKCQHFEHLDWHSHMPSVRVNARTLR